jgi:WXG100 family type VII secretion target
MSDIIEADYEMLQQIATRFAHQGDEVEQMLRLLYDRMDALEGQWAGNSYNAFATEMHDLVLPACDRLFKVMHEASQVTQQVIREMQSAEEEAASSFQFTS